MLKINDVDFTNIVFTINWNLQIYMTKGRRTNNLQVCHPLCDRITLQLVETKNCPICKSALHSAH